MGLCFDTVSWDDLVWEKHIEASFPAQQILERGGKRTTAKTWKAFTQDVHSRLYNSSEDSLEVLDTAPSWAIQIHRVANESEEWQHLKAACARNELSAGVAAETVLSSLLDHIIDRNFDEEKEIPDAEARRALRRAARTAQEAVEEADMILEAIGPTAGLGGGTGLEEANLDQARDAWDKLRNLPKIKQIAEMAGRLARLARNRSKTTVRGGIGETYGLDQGDDLARILPGELANLRHPILRKLVLAKILEKTALQYGMRGPQPMAKGPIIVLLDESSSMLANEQDIWSKAVALAMLQTASIQKRDWCVITFNGYIRQCVILEKGCGSITDICSILSSTPWGGTNFTHPVEKAIEVIRHSKSMKSADVLVITDGDGPLDDETAEKAQKLTSEEGVNWYAIGIGPYAEKAIESLKSIATETICVRYAMRDAAKSEKMVDIIALT